MLGLHEAYARIGEHMQSRMIETIVFVSSHGEGYARAFAFAQHEPAHTSLREYGTMEYEYRWRMDTRLIDAAQRASFEKRMSSRRSRQTNI